MTMTFQEYLKQRDDNFFVDKWGQRIGSWLGAGAGAAASLGGAAGSALTGNIPLFIGSSASVPILGTLGHEVGGTVGNYIGDKVSGAFKNNVANNVKKAGDNVIQALQNWKQKIIESRNKNPELMRRGIEQQIDKVIGQINKENQRAIINPSSILTKIPTPQQSQHTYDDSVNQLKPQRRSQLRPINPQRRVL